MISNVIELNQGEITAVAGGIANKTEKIIFWGGLIVFGVGGGIVGGLGLISTYPLYEVAAIVGVAIYAMCHLLIINKTKKTHNA